jgi:histidyl-tRNA synthetase
MKFQAPRGTEDVLPDQSPTWIWLEAKFRQICDLYGFREIRTPTFEDTDLFLRTAGETSDIVTKEMYTFQDKGGRSCTLKPEGTAPVMRAVLEHSLCPPGTHLKLSYIVPCFRYGRPGKGRLRELHQFGLELIGTNSVRADAEVIEASARFFDAAGISDYMFLVNSIGRAECRARYRQAILDHVATYLSDTSTEERAKAEKNPLGLLDSKDPAVQGALQGVPSILDYLESESAENFMRLQQLLVEAAIPFQVDPRVVRGLDYYTDTVFEVQTASLGPQISICGGGRYDGLIQELGGSATPSVGVGIGVERVLLALETLGNLPPKPVSDVFIVQASEGAAGACRGLARNLRLAGISVLEDLDSRSLKSQFRQADKSGAAFAVVIGDDELAAGSAQLKSLASGAQATVPIREVADRIVEGLRP